MEHVTRQRFPVWDLTVRLFHWSLVVLVALQWASSEFEWLDLGWHFKFGYVILALLLTRIAWGLVGSSNARFSAFLRGPATVRRYLAASRRGEAGEHSTHNPLGGWSVVALLLSVLTQAVTGLFLKDDIDWVAPLNGLVSKHTAKLLHEIHEANANVLLALIALHLVAIGWYRLARRDDLVAPMFSGRKPLSSDPRIRFVSPWIALAIFLLMMGGVWWLTAWGEAH